MRNDGTRRLPIRRSSLHDLPNAFVTTSARAASKTQAWTNCELSTDGRVCRPFRHIARSCENAGAQELQAVALKSVSSRFALQTDSRQRGALLGASGPWMAGVGARGSRHDILVLDRFARGEIGRAHV